jgi:hypothetical protein
LEATRTTGNGKRATQGYKYARKIIDMPDDTVSLQISLDFRRSTRRNNEFILTMQSTKSDAHFSSSLNTTRRIWNNIPRETSQINSLTNFKEAMKKSSKFDFRKIFSSEKQYPVSFAVTNP